ncbi:hypothetical protein BDB01DRAFT_894809 [Pilobolus umbonatus]|nr:hypothetical protein BDB01DRAFT_894809 [Pilobolus umbonatus]
MEEDQEICRVCRSESTPEHPLYHPCRCSGSIRFVHEDCLIEWLSHSKKKYCELCEYPFTFSPIYREDMPDHVPILVVFKQLFYRVFAALKSCLRGLAVVFVWLVILPNFTLLTWRFYFWSGENIGFNRNMTELLFPNNSVNTTMNTEDNENNDYLSSSIKTFLSGCLEGQVITAFVIVIFVAAYLFREWVMQNLPVDVQPNQVNPEVVEDVNNNDIQLLHEQAALDALMNAMQVINPADEPAHELNRLENELNGLRDDLHHGLDNNTEDSQKDWSSLVQESADEHPSDGSTEAGPSSGETYLFPQSNDNDDSQWMNEDDDLPDLVEVEERDFDPAVYKRLYDNSLARRHGMEDGHEITREDLLTLNREHQEQLMQQQREEADQQLRDRLQQELQRHEQIQRFHDQLQQRDIIQRQQRRQQREQREQRQQREEREVQRPPVAAVIPEEEEPFDVAEDINGVLEAIGMRGNPRMLIQNSVLMSLMISLCLGIAVWIPYVIGRLVILIRPMSFIEKPIYLMRLLTDPLVDFVLDLCVPFLWSIFSRAFSSVIPENIQTALISLQEQLTKMLSSAPVTPVENTPVISSTTSAIDIESIQSKIEVICNILLTRWHQFAVGQTGLDRSMCILVGYIVLICLGSWYLTHVSRRRNETTATGENIEDIIRQQGIFLKVLFFILIELVIFPTICGFLLDMATLPLFANASFASRYTFHLKSSYSSYFLHWFLGTGVLFYFAIFITVCREIIRPGVMWFIRDPNDPQFHPVQEMVERPLPNLLQKISQSAMIYSAMLVFGVGTVTYLLAYTGIVFPLRLPFHIPLSTLAIDLLIIQFLLPPLISLIKPREYSKKALDLWWHTASRQLRLTSFMFNKRMPDEEGKFVRRTLKSFLLRETIDVTLDEFSEVSIEDENKPVVFKRDGMFARVPKYDSVPVDPHRRMIVPVDPITLEAIDEDERRHGHPAAKDSGSEADSTIIVYIPPYFMQRIIFFLFYMWVFISLFTCSVTVLPLLIGRALFDIYLAPGSQVNDLYSFALGLYVMTFMAYCIYWGSECYNVYKENGYNLKRDAVIQYIKEKVMQASKAFYLGAVFGIVLPLLVGIAVDLFVFMPFRTIDSEVGLVINLSQNWSFGIAYMSIVYNAIHVLPPRNGLRLRLDEIIGNDIMRTDVWTITRTIILFVISVAMLAIVIPAFISWGILQMLDPNDPELQVKVTRYTYPSIFCIFVLAITGYVCKKLLNLWMETVRDDAYLIGKRLHNMNSEEDTSRSTPDEHVHLE